MTFLYSGANFYPANTPFDLRDALNKVLYGSVTEPPMGQVILWRQLTDTKCACWDNSSGGPIQSCTYCQGEGYQFYESLQTVYINRQQVPKPGSAFPLSPIGLGNIPQDVVAYSEYSMFPNYEAYTFTTKANFDKIYELKVNDDGTLVVPYIKTKKWILQNVTPYIGDYGRVEYFALGLKQQTT